VGGRRRAYRRLVDLKRVSPAPVGSELVDPKWSGRRLGGRRRCHRLVDLKRVDPRLMASRLEQSKLVGPRQGHPREGCSRRAGPRLTASRLDQSKLVGPSQGHRHKRCRRLADRGLVLRGNLGSRDTGLGRRRRLVCRANLGRGRLAVRSQDRAVDTDRRLGLGVRLAGSRRTWRRAHRAVVEPMGLAMR